MFDLADADNRTLNTANNTRLWILGKTTVELHFEHVNIDIDCYVVNTLSTSVLLGCDVLSEIQANIDFVNNELTVLGGQITLPMVGRPRQKSVAYLTRDTIIPARTEKTVEFRLARGLRSSQDNMVVMVSANQEVSEGIELGFANVITEVTRGRVATRVLNPWNHNVVLKKNKQYVTAVEAYDNEISTINCARKLPGASISGLSTTIEDITSQETSQKKKIDELGIELDKDLDPALRGEIIRLVEEYPDIWATSYADIREGSKLRPAEIKVIPGTTFERNKTYRVSPKTRDIQAKLLNELVEAEIMEETKEILPFLNNVILVKKPNGSYRLVMDMRFSNKYCETEEYSIPLIEDLFLAVGSNQGKEVCFTVLDMYSAYNQVFLDEPSRRLTGVYDPSKRRILQSTRLVQGSKNSVATFQRRMSEIFQSMDPLKILIYLDDLMCVSSLEEHPKLLRQVFQTLREYRLKLSPKKAQIARQSVKYMGYHLTSRGICIDEERIKILNLIKPPKDLHQLRQIIGQLQYFSKMIPGYSIILSPMRKLLKQDQKFEWSAETQAALDKIKEELRKQVVLAHVDTSRGMKIAIDASRKGLGYSIEQMDEETKEWRPIAFGGRGLTEHERVKLGVSELELTALAYALLKNRTILNNGQQHIVETDHISNTYVNGLAKTTNGKLARLYMLISDFNLILKYRPGRNMGAPDMFSRAFTEEYVPEPGDTVEEELSEVVVTAVQELSPEIETVHYKSAREIEGERATVNILDKEAEEDRQLQWSEVKINRIDLKKLQREDKELQLLIDYLENRKLPDDRDLAKEIVVRSELYFVSGDGVLCRVLHNSKKLKNNDVLHETVVIPKSMQQDLVRDIHAALGHKAVGQVYATLTQRWYFDQAYTKIKKYLRTCDTCQRVRIDKTYRRQPLQTVPIEGQPLRNWSMDTMTLPTSESTGCHLVLVAIDQQTKFVEAYPLKEENALTLAACLLDLCARYGCPETLRTDRGASWLSTTYSQLCKRLGIKAKMTSSYLPRSDGQVERANQAILEALRAKLQDEADWVLGLPFALMSIRGAVTETTGFSPHEMVYGKQMVLPPEASMVTSDRSSWPLYARDYLNETEERLQVVREIALENSKKTQETQKKAYDKRYRAIGRPAFTPGEVVLLRNLHMPSNALRKVIPNFKGPYMIDQVVGVPGESHTYYLKDQKTGKLHPHPINEFHLKRYREEDGSGFKKKMFRSMSLYEINEEMTQEEEENKQEEEKEEQEGSEGSQVQRPEGVDEEKEGTDQSEEEWYEIEKITGAKTVGGRTKYQVKWKGYAILDWVDQDDVTEEAERQYLKSHTKQGKKRKKKHKNVRRM